MRSNHAVFRICLVCGRSVPLASGEKYCINDGQRLLEKCPKCQAKITSPYARFCPQCAYEFRLKPVTEQDAVNHGSKNARVSHSKNL